MDPVKHNYEVRDLIALLEDAILYEEDPPSDKDVEEAITALHKAANAVSRYATDATLAQFPIEFLVQEDD